MSIPVFFSPARGKRVRPVSSSQTMDDKLKKSVRASAFVVSSVCSGDIADGVPNTSGPFSGYPYMRAIPKSPSRISPSSAIHTLLDLTSR